MIIDKFIIWRNKPRIDLLRTLIINKKYIKDWWKFPIFIYKGTKFRSLCGKIIFQNNPGKGSIKIGFRNDAASVQDLHTVLNLNGKLVFNGYCIIGTGNFINIYDPSATLSIGNNVGINNNNVISCGKSVTIDHDVLIANNCEITDSDYHYIVKGENVYDNRGSVIIDSNCWIGNECKVLKGSRIYQGSVLGCKSVYTKSSFKLKSGIYLGCPAKYVGDGSLIRNKWDEEVLLDKFQNGQEVVNISELPIRQWWKYFATF